MQQKDIIMKWFDKIELDSCWRDQVEKAAEIFDPEEIDKEENPFRFLKEKGNKLNSLLYCLYRCEALEKKYKEMGIQEKILLDTLSDIKIQAEDTYNTPNDRQIGLKEVTWLELHLTNKLYKLGRLQFQFTKAKYDFPDYGIVKGENCIAIHITRSTPLDPEECAKSYGMLEDFLAKFYPDYDFRYFSAGTWLLDDYVMSILRPTSNILKVMKEYNIVSSFESDDALNYLFTPGTKLEDVKDEDLKTGLQKNIVSHLRNGGKLYEGYGYRKRQKKERLHTDYTEVILKWFDVYGLDPSWRKEVEENAKKFDPSYLDSLEKPFDYLKEFPNRMTLLLYCLYRSEALKKEYDTMGIPEDIFFETMNGIKIHSTSTFKSSGEVGINNAGWMALHVEHRIHKLGRLQFHFNKAKKSFPEFGIQPGDNVVNIHITRGDPLTLEECHKSYKFFEEFLAKFYPDYTFKYYTISSWLLGSTLEKLLKPTSNILQSMSEFTRVSEKENPEALSMVFPGHSTIESIKPEEIKTSLQRNMYDFVKQGGKLYSGHGFRPRYY